MEMSFWEDTCKRATSKYLGSTGWNAADTENSDSATYSSESDSILQRTTELSKELQQKETEVLAAFAGMRPSREGGARIERDEIPINGERRIIVHNYGAGGTGFQAGYGMALDAVKSIEDILSTLPTKSLL